MFTPPDWLDANNYPDSKRGEVIPSAWAWEFLRRNMEFQRDYQASIRKIGGHTAVRQQAIKFAERWCLEISATGVPSLAAPEVSCVLDKSLGQYLPPVTFAPQMPQYVFDSATGGAVVCPADKTLEASERIHVMWVKIDLRIALDRQITAVQKLAERAQWLRGNTIESTRGPRRRISGKSEPLGTKLHQSRFGTYLRILDAKAAGASRKKIESALNSDHKGSGKRWVEDSEKAAQQFRDTKWRLILELSPSDRPNMPGVQQAQRSKK